MIGSTLAVQSGIVLPSIIFFKIFKKKAQTANGNIEPVSSQPVVKSLVLNKELHEKLSQDLLSEITHYFSFKELASVHRVSRRWKEFYSQEKQRDHMSFFSCSLETNQQLLSSGFLTKIFNDFKKLKYVSLSGISITIAEIKLLRHLSLKHLSLADCPINDSQMEELFDPSVESAFFMNKQKLIQVNANKNEKLVSETEGRNDNVKNKKDDSLGKKRSKSVGAESSTSFNVSVIHCNLFSIESLNLRKTQITNQSLYVLTSLPNLIYLDLSFCPNIGFVGISYLVENCSSLQSLMLAHTETTDRTLRAFSKTSTLTFLDLTSCSITDAGVMQHLAYTFSLKSLNLTNTEITNKGLWSLKHLLLENLVLESCNINDIGLSHLPRTLRSLVLTDSKIHGGEEFVMYLSKLTSLTFLDVNNCKNFNYSCLQDLTKKLTGCVINPFVEKLEQEEV